MKRIRNMKKYTTRKTLTAMAVVAVTMTSVVVTERARGRSRASPRRSATRPRSSRASRPRRTWASPAGTRRRRPTYDPVRSSSTSARAAGSTCSSPRRRSGPTGKAIGIDMTPEMLERARANAERQGLDERRVPRVDHRQAAARRRLGRLRHLELRHQPRPRQAAPCSARSPAC